MAPGLRQIVREWGRIGCVGFGGPPAHVALLRELCVERREWMDAQEFEDANAACGLLPGPASTQLAIYCARRVGGLGGAVAGGLAFILPGLAALLALAALTLQDGPPDLVRGAAAGAGAAVVAVVVGAGVTLARTSLAGRDGSRLARALAYLAVGVIVTVAAGALVVVALLACGAIELTLRRATAAPGVVRVHALPAALALGATGAAALPALVWTSLKVGALSYGGGLVIVPLMQHDAVDVHRWMTDTEFLNAVALGQLTPGPVVQTVGAVGYAAAGLGGGLLAAAVAFTPSFLIVAVGGSRFGATRANLGARAFLDGAGPAAIGAIFGAAVPLLGGVRETWQAVVLATTAALLLGRRLGTVPALALAAVAGVAVTAAGGPLP